MKSCYPTAGNSSDTETEAPEQENLLFRFSAGSNDPTISPSLDGTRQRTIPKPLSAMLCALKSLRTHRHHRPVARRVSQSKYILLSLHFFGTVPRPLRLRPRTIMFFSFVILTWTPVFLLALALVYGGIPPDYSAVKRWERELPQHIWRRPAIMNALGKLGKRNDKDTAVEDGRQYLRFPDHLWGHGLNNVLQEALLTSHLAHRARRSFVFEDFTWSHLPLPYTLYDFALRPTRVPLSAFLGGWVVGGGMSGNSQRQGVGEGHGNGVRAGSTPRKGDVSDGVNDGDGASGSTPSVNLTSPTSTSISALAHAAIEERRAVSAEYFEYVCPPSRRIEIWYERDVSPASNVNHPASSQANSDGVAGRIVSTRPPLENEASGSEIVEWWIHRLQQPDVRDEPCVVVREEERRVFDSHFFGSTRILSLFDELKRSPVLRGFTWSPLVQHALEKTMLRFFGNNVTPTPASIPESTIAPPTSSSSSPSSAPMQPSSLLLPPIIPGLLAIHIRRGDYKRHCLRLAEWRAGYMGFNRFEGILDTFDVEEHLRGHPNTTVADDAEDSRRTMLLDEHRTTYYLAHCLPTIKQIVQRLHDVREEYQHSLDVKRGRASSANYALRDVYVLTNGWPAFVHELRLALLADGWTRVMATPQLVDPNTIDSAVASLSEGGIDQDVAAGRSRPRRDTVDAPSKATATGLTREEKGVSVALDMGFAQRAEVFVGNGFSSLSSNIVMLRLAKGMPMCSNRLL